MTTNVRLENVHTDETRELGGFDYVELTYNSIRIAPDGRCIANYDKELDWWVLDADSSQWSDVIIYSD